MEDNLRGTILLTSLIVIICFVVIILCVDNVGLINGYTRNYETISVADASALIESNDNLYIIDCREGCGPCQFNKGHIDGAGLYDSPESFYNTTHDILVYSVDGAVGEQFCQELVGNVYGKIYNLEGGWNEWVSYHRRI